MRMEMVNKAEVLCFKLFYLNFINNNTQFYAIIPQNIYHILYLFLPKL